MARAPFQVVVFPYRQKLAGSIEYALFLRSDFSCWQGVAGGGEEGETPLEAAQRESLEEANIPVSYPFLRLDTVSSIPVSEFKERYLWEDDVYVILEYAFAVNVGTHEIRLSAEHKAVRWLDYEAAVALVKYDSNRTALWELNERLSRRATKEGGMPI